jgi:hypothetical protein
MRSRPDTSLSSSRTETNENDAGRPPVSTEFTSHVLPDDPDFAIVAESWNRLPELIRQGIVAMNALKAARAGEFLLVILGVEQIWIYVVTDQYCASYDQTGFAAVGSGSTFSVPVLAAKRVHKAVDLEHALYAAFETKRASEGVGTVGSQTDMAIVAVGRPTRFLSGDLIEELEAMYQRRLVLAKSEKNTIRRLIGA